jgi:hypothetical protein
MEMATIRTIRLETARKLIDQHGDGNRCEIFGSATHAFESVRRLFEQLNHGNKVPDLCAMPSVTAVGVGLAIPLQIEVDMLGRHGPLIYVFRTPSTAVRYAIQPLRACDVWQFWFNGEEVGQAAFYLLQKCWLDEIHEALPFDEAACWVSIAQIVYEYLFAIVFPMNFTDRVKIISLEK